MDQKLSKKIILAAVVGVAVLGGLAWSAYHKKPQSTAPPESSQLTSPPGFVPPYTNPPGGKPQPERLKELAERPTIDLALTQERAAPGETVSANWLVTYPTPPGNATHTALHWDAVSHNDVLEAQLSETTYAHAEGEFIGKASIIPRSFTANIVLPTGVPTVYVRVDAVVGGQRYWSAEKFIGIAAP